MGHDDGRKPRTAAEETGEEVREALTSVGEEEPDEERSGEAGDALRPDEHAQEWAYGEPPERGPERSPERSPERH
ncbi:hypothetical protein DVA86_08940 [Streptomyces armeniacus]|uniref:Uncharacterized protein n=1 Tax=Streptomyces armeniacus TaxID=83291 RepID=A0A345XM86_9ACTN|nr:hypothetical protein [Streptomyces armeniacus]AXK32752.1 hypothetical protein DVA86_08940 [Streptomyces armeniacus]